MGHINYYSERLKQYGSDVRALGWGSEGSQRLRFKVLSEITDLCGQTVLDFGCGFGDLYAFLKTEVSYIGYDSDPEMLAQAKIKYPTALFIVCPREADYVLASGTFNLVADYRPAISFLWTLCHKGMAVNFTSALAEKQTPGIVYADPFEAARFCSTLSKKFVLRTDYKENDFCIYLYR
jgi:SAM-dependent methyltransferase